MVLSRRCCLALMLLLSVGSARADDEAAHARSRELNAAATKAMDAGDLPTALQRYREAYAAFPSAKLHFNLGLVLDKLGRRAEAADELQAFLDEVPDAPPDAQSFSRGKLATLVPMLARLTVRCAPEAARLRVDDATRTCGKALHAEPGTHTVELEADGFAPARQSLVLAAGDARTVDVALASTSISVERAIDAPPERHAPSRVAPIAVGAASGALLVAGFAMYGAGQAKFLDLKHQQQPNFQPSDRSRQYRDVGLAGVGIAAAGGVLLIVDIALWASDAHQRREAR